MSELGLGVSEHIMRRHYGIDVAVPFEAGKHPEELKRVDYDGQAYCTKKMLWIAKRVVD